MPTVTATAIAGIPVSEAWDKLSDLGKAHFYVPDLTGTEITTAVTRGVGASRRVYSRRAPLTETVIDWREGSGFILRLHGDGLPPLFSQATFEYRISAESATETRLSNTMRFDVKWGLAGKLLGALLLRPMTTMQQRITFGQKRYYETGAKADPAEVSALMKRERQTLR